MPVTGHIIGDQPKRELGNIPKTLIIQKEGKKQTRLWDGHSIPKQGYESYSTGEEQKASTKECMRYIIYYRQNVDNILAWKIIHNRLLG